jgi:tetratricopeptide (TPR) repeat protein/predicted Ser/Thr protein kinase
MGWMTRSSVTPPVESLSPSAEAGSLASLLGAVARTGHAPLAPGTLVADQYRIVRPIGEGGMGVVYLARDNTLHRDVAVKLCTGLSASAVHRIQREAMALAKLAHPNVVVVYQAGEIDGRFFIAMEYVAGGTAGAWIEGRRASEIVALYAAAGDGLAAAHRAGLVHRDFKPDNVLVDSDGRPRVADFGLARASEDAETYDDDPVANARHTQAGAVMGTLAYMAPEQLEGIDVDARADQYAFAVSLWEALFGERPTKAQTVSIPEGTSRSMPRSRASNDSVPKHVTAALLRALSEDRAQRWPDMNALLHELRRDPAATRRRAIAMFGAIALIGVGAATASMWGGEQPAPQCTDAPAQIAEVWNDDRSSAIALVVGDTAWPPIEERLSARVTEWVEQHRAACRATRIDGSASEDVLDRRMLCLDARKQQLESTLRALEHGTATAVSNAPVAIDSLPASEACLSALPFGEQELPSDPAVREQIREAQSLVAEATAASLDPSALDGYEKAQRGVELAKTTGWPPIIAEAATARAEVLSGLMRRTEALAAFTEAQHLAIVADNDVLAIYAYADGAEMLAEAGRAAEAQQWLAIAHSLWERSGKDPADGQRVLGATANVAWQDHRPQDALEATLEQVELTDEAFGSRLTSQAANQMNLALAYERVGRSQESLDAIHRAIDLAIAAVGADHPTVAKCYAIRAEILMRAGDLTEAQGYALRSLSISERWFGPHDPRQLQSLTVLFEVVRRRGDFGVAQAIGERALDIRKRSDPGSPDIAKDESNLAMIAVEQGDYDAAAPRAAASLAMLEATFGPDKPDLINALILVGYIARERPEPELDASARHLTRARDIAYATIGRDTADAVNADIELAKTRLVLGEATEVARELEERSVELATMELPPVVVGELRLTLAQALHRSGASKRGCALAGEAEEKFRAAELLPMVTATTQWRSKHCPTGSSEP